MRNCLDPSFKTNSWVTLRWKIMQQRGGGSCGTDWLLGWWTGRISICMQSLWCQDWLKVKFSIKLLNAGKIPLAHAAISSSAADTSSHRPAMSYDTGAFCVVTPNFKHTHQLLCAWKLKLDAKAKCNNTKMPQMGLIWTQNATVYMSASKNSCVTPYPGAAAVVEKQQWLKNLVRMRIRASGTCKSLTEWYSVQAS